MKAIKDNKSGLWKLDYHFIDWQGNRKRSTKRGFKTKREAQEWGNSFVSKKQVDLTMLFRDFVNVYFEDMETRLREHTIVNKHYIIDGQVLPYFKDMRLCDIKAPTIRKWQNGLIKAGYTKTYLKTINNQMSAIMNHAVRFYELESNPCRKAGTIGKNRADKMQFWTKEEFEIFNSVIGSKNVHRIVFSVLYWTGVRIGELLALGVYDIDIEKKTISIKKSYQRLNGKDVITDPKTPKSKRVINIPAFLAADLKDYISNVYDAEASDRLFNLTIDQVRYGMRQGISKSGVKKIRLHDLRHSHCSYLIELGFTPAVIAERLGHEKVETTLNTYGHLYPNKQVEIAAQLEKEYQKEFV